MNEHVDALISIVRRVSEAFVKEHCKDEIRIFPVIWDAFEQWVRSAPTPGEPPITSGGALAEALGGLGFAEQEPPKLMTPLVLTTIFTVVLEAAMIGDEITRPEVNSLVGDRGKGLGVPEDLLSSLEGMMWPLVKSDIGRLAQLYNTKTPFESITKPPFESITKPPFEEFTLIRWDAQTRTGSREELASEIEKTRSEKHTFDLFLDDEKNLLLVKGKKVSLQRKLNQKRLLVLLLLRVGGYCTFTDLSDKIWSGGDKNRTGALLALLCRLHRTTRKILREFVSIGTAEEKCYVLDDLKKDVKYAVIFRSEGYYLRRGK